MSLPDVAEKFKERCDRFFKTAQKPGCCIFCQCRRVHWNGSRQRTASVLVEDQVVYLTDILCRRVKCVNPGCKKSWTLRPTGLMPRRHYQLCIVDCATRKFLYDPHATLTSIADEHRCSRWTIRRWLNWIAGIGEVSDLIDRLTEALKQSVYTAAVKVDDALSTACCVCKKAFLRSAQIFCLLDALGLAYGYKPCGFVHLIEAVIAGRDRVTTYQSPAIPELAR